MHNRVLGGRTGLEDDIYDALIGEEFRATIDRLEPSNVVRSWAVGGGETLSVEKSGRKGAVNEIRED